MSNAQSTLLTWHARRAGLEVLTTGLALLAEAGSAIDKVWLLVQPEDLADVRRGLASVGVPVDLLRIEIDDPTAHRPIADRVRVALSKRLEGLSGDLHVNVSPGTPAMHAVWLFMHAGGELPRGTRLWSTQKRGREGPVTLSPVDFEVPPTYLTRIRRRVRGAIDRRTYRVDSPSPARRAALERLARCGRIPHASVLILGERGVGKTRLIERYMPVLKDRKTIVTVACGALDPALAESRLFGYARGAHSTATRTEDGLLHAAQGGIIFFDEVQDLARPVQRKLVRLLEERRFARIGETKEAEADIELVFGSNRRLDELREVLDPDLLDRLAMLVVEIPPLRDCREAIMEDWSAVWSDVSKGVPDEEAAPWSSSLAAALGRSALPGNFRDLQRLAYELLLASDDQFDDTTIGEALEHWMRPLPRAAGAGEPEFFGPGTAQRRVARFQSALAKWAIATHGTQKRAAEALDCSERSLRNWLTQG